MIVVEIDTEAAGLENVRAREQTRRAEKRGALGRSAEVGCAYEGNTNEHGDNRRSAEAIRHWRSCGGKRREGSSARSSGRKHEGPGGRAAGAFVRSSFGPRAWRGRYESYQRARC